MNMTHEARREAARTINTEPTLTDQSAARETDLNIILSRHGQSGVINSHGKQPLYMDWTQAPVDLRGFLELQQTMEKRRAELPNELRDIPIEQLVYMTPEEITARMTPPETPKQEEPPK